MDSHEFVKLLLHAATLFDIICDHLCDMYKRTRFTPKGAEWPPNQAKIVVSVVLIHHKGKRTLQELLEIVTIHKEGATAIDKLVSSKYQGSYVKKPPLNYSTVTKNITDIFAADPTETGCSSTETPKRILIEGAPGIGKTVMAKEIVYQWTINEVLTEMKLVFLLYLRDPQLQLITTTKQLVEYMSMGCLDDEQIILLNKYLVNNKGQQLCIVMDGFDEYPASLQKNSFIVNIIKGVILPKAIVVITSRPTATVSLHDQVDRRIDILGFPKEEREKYISKLFSSSIEKKNKLKKYLKQQPVINGLCFVPLHLSILLYLFQQGSLPETLTEMNESFILHTIYRHLERQELTPSGPIDKLSDLPKAVLHIVLGLAVLAFNGLQQNKLVFTFDDIKQSCPCIHETVGAINGFGLVQAVEHYPQKGVGTTKSFNFLHYTMQEFLAALHVSTLPSEPQSSLMEKTFWDGHYNFMWMMFVGIVGVRSDIFIHFIYKGNENEGIMIFPDVIRKDKRKLLHVFQCYLEAKENKEAPQVIPSMFKNGDITFNQVSLLPHSITSLMSFIHTKKSIQWKQMQLQQCEIGDIGMSILQQFISDNTSTLEYVDLSHNDSSPWGVYCAIIRHCSVNNLALCGIQASEMKEYVREITRSLRINRTLKSLTLCNIVGNIKPIKMVLSCITTLKEVNLPIREVTNNKDLHNVKAVFLHTTLQCRCDDTVLASDNNRTLKVTLLCNQSCNPLTMENQRPSAALYQKIDNYGATVIATFCNKLEKVNLSSKRISDSGVIAINDFLKTNFYLLELNLSENKITNKGVKEITEVIEINSVLQSINISKNHISIDGLLYFMEAVNKNNTLQKVNITHNNVTRFGFKGIKQYIENLQHSIQIIASWNEINVNGQLISKISTSDVPHNIEVDIWSFEEYDSDHLIMCLCECLKEDDTQQELRLPWNKITSEGVNLIVEVIKVTVSIKKLDIRTIDNYGTIAISDCLKSSKSLQELSISFSHITTEGAIKISEAIQVNTTLKNLDLSQNTISDGGVAAISDCLKINNTLQELCMAFSHITSEGAKKIGEAIQVNKTLRKLDLSHNAISDDGVVAISDGLKSSKSMQELNISYNIICNVGAKGIAEAIKVNTTLHTLHVNQPCGYDELSFNMTILTSVHHNKTLMKLSLPSVCGGDESLMSSEVEKINRERKRQGICTLTLSIQMLNPLHHFMINKFGYIYL